MTGHDEELPEEELPPRREDLYDFLGAQALAGLMSWEQVQGMLTVLEFQAVDIQRLQTLYERMGGRGRPDWLALLEASRSRPPPVPGSGEPLHLPEPPDWWAGATADEILFLDLYPGGPDGSDLLSIEDAELTRREIVVATRLGQGQESRWLLAYADKLLEERHRRRHGLREAAG